MFINKNSKLNDVLNIIKLGTIVFASYIIMKHINGQIYYVFEKIDSAINFLLTVLITALVISLYYLWSFIIIKKVKADKIIIGQVIEALYVIILFAFFILFTDKNLSQYKIIFIFIIIPSTIQFGKKFGVTLSLISSMFILAVDLIYSPKNIINNYFESDLITLALFFLTAWILGYFVELQSQNIIRLENKANVDGLTGLYNHRYFCDELNKKVKNYKLYENSVSLIFLDIDFFKEYNDLYGHMSGDKVLVQVGELLKKTISDDAFIARYGGDEFAVILTDKPDEEVLSISENIRNAMQDAYFEGEEHLSSNNLTLSIGIAKCSESINSDLELIKCADDALYRAKFFKKNRVEVYTSILDKLMLDIEAEHLDLIISIKTLISIINAKDRYTYGHIERVVSYAKMIAVKLDLTDEDKKILIYGAYMHDIGKINISEHILNKKMQLTDEEWNIMRQHPVDGVSIIKQVESLSQIVPLIMHHHEKYDGSGYPDNLVGRNIPYYARVLTVLDSFDAMTSKRPYKPAMSFTEAKQELIRNSGTHFDPEIVKVFCEVIDEISYGKDTYVPRKHNKEFSKVKKIV